jgi:hypothetical protein
MFGVEATTTENPAEVAGAAPQLLTEAATFADLEAALVEPCGAEHAARAVAVMERLMLAREDELAAKFEARLGRGGAPLDSVAAALTRAESLLLYFTTNEKSGHRLTTLTFLCERARRAQNS